MGIESLLTRLEATNVTPVTRADNTAVTVKVAPAQGCTDVTPVTSHSSIPDTVAANAVFPAVNVSLASMPASDEATIRAWLAHIGEDDAATIADVLARTAADTVERNRLLPFARSALRLVSHQDDRRYCCQCANLANDARCLAAWRGEIVASRYFEPVLDVPHRCAAYLPGPHDPDRRTGNERWPQLHRKGNHHGEETD